MVYVWYFQLFSDHSICLIGLREYGFYLFMLDSEKYCSSEQSSEQVFHFFNFMASLGKKQLFYLIIVIVVTRAIGLQPANNKNFQSNFFPLQSQSYAFRWKIQKEQILSLFLVTVNICV